MPRSGRLRHFFALLVSLLLVLVLLLVLAPAPAATAATAAAAEDAPPAGYDEALARRMIVYSSIAISEPEQVDAWVFPNPRT